MNKSGLPVQEKREQERQLRMKASFEYKII